MAVSTFFGMNPLVAHSPIAADLQQFRGFEGVKQFDGQNFFVQGDRVEQVRARTFFGLLEQNFNSQEKNKSSLHFLLRQTLQLSNSEEAKQFSGEISQAFFKRREYFSRLFSGESWEERTENRSALGKVTSQFRDCLESRIQVDSFTKKLDEEVVRRANQEAEALLKNLNHRDESRERSFLVDSCATGLVGGAFGSLLTQHPWPLLIGLSGCFPTVSAQQKVGSEFQVNNYIANNQQFPSVASFPNGNFVVTWESLGQDGDVYGVYGQLFNRSGSKFGAEFQINTYTLDEQRKPSVTNLNNSNFVVTWYSKLQDGSGNGVYGQIFNETGGEIRSEFQVNTFTDGHQALNSIASLNNGNFVVIWDSYQDGSGTGIYGQVFNGTGFKIGNEFQVNSHTTDYQNYPSARSLRNGNFIVAWTSGFQDGSGQGVYGQLFDENGSRIGNEFRINTYTTDEQVQSSIGSLNNGNFVVTWSSDGQDGDGMGVYGQLFNGNGTNIGNEFQVNTESVNSQNNPSITSLGNSHFIVTWQSFVQDGSDWGVYGQLFIESGSKIGNEFRINTYTTSDQSQPSVASLQDNNFVVTWHSYLQDSSSYGVYGQIFYDNFTFTSSTSTSTTSRTSSLPISSPNTSTTSPSFFISSQTTSLPISSSTHSEIPLSSIRSNRNFLWLWLLLGIGGGTTCLSLTGYYLSKKRKEKTSLPQQAELGTVEMPSTDESRDDSHRDYANRPKKARLDSEYANRPKREKRGSEYANRPKRADRDSLYANVPDAGSESSETDIVA